MSATVIDSQWTPAGRSGDGERWRLTGTDFVVTPTPGLRGRGLGGWALRCGQDRYLLSAESMTDALAFVEQHPGWVANLVLPGWAQMSSVTESGPWNRDLLGAGWTAAGITALTTRFMRQRPKSFPTDQSILALVVLCAARVGPEAAARALEAGPRLSVLTALTAVEEQVPVSFIAAVNADDTLAHLFGPDPSPYDLGKMWDSLSFMSPEAQAEWVAAAAARWASPMVVSRRLPRAESWAFDDVVSTFWPVVGGPWWWAAGYTQTEAETAVRGLDESGIAALVRRLKVQVSLLR